MSDDAELLRCYAGERAEETRASRQRVRIYSLFLIGGLLTAGCRTPPRLEGRSSVEQVDTDPPLLQPASRSGKKIQVESTDVEYIPGYIKSPLAKPVYPPAALAAHAGTYVIVVKVTVDEAGRVSDVTRSVRDIALPNPFERDFLEAIRTVAACWQFSPSHNVYYERGTDGQRKYVRTETLTDSLDLKFTFEATGAVK